MPNIKTAISIDKPLFEEVDALAQEMEISRSHLFSLAARSFIQHHKNHKLLDAINSAYGGLPDLTEENLYKQRRPKHRDMVKGQW